MFAAHFHFRAPAGGAAHFSSVFILCCAFSPRIYVVYVYESTIDIITCLFKNLSIYPIPHIALDFRCRRKMVTLPESIALDRPMLMHWIRICRAIPSTASLAILSIGRHHIHANVSSYCINFFEKIGSIAMLYGFLYFRLNF